MVIFAEFRRESASETCSVSSTRPRLLAERRQYWDACPLGITLHLKDRNESHGA
jgi:hypothetical protein